MLKPENMQRTGAYKVRGAYYKISTLTDEERARGLTHRFGRQPCPGVANAAKVYGVTPPSSCRPTTPLIKVERTKDLGAEVVLAGNVYDEAYEEAVRLPKNRGSRSSIRSTTWPWPQARAPLPWKSCRSCLSWILSWPPSAAAD